MSTLGPFCLHVPFLHGCYRDEAMRPILGVLPQSRTIEMFFGSKPLGFSSYDQSQQKSHYKAHSKDDDKLSPFGEDCHPSELQNARHIKD